mmetsp:Transcript_16582/g.48091  ORF Transcript_16582/g.48091 Transcript_16582/m.48091 type:complete len:394 (-) Transcript_16582:42-1223(-)
MVISTPPPPLDNPSLTDPLQCPPLRWGMLGCGRVSHDFTQALKHLPSQSVVACSARSNDSAEAFAQKHGIKNFYGSYDEMLKDENIDIVYIGNIHAFRKETVTKSLMAKKHVLVEKPFACSVADAEKFIALAKKNDLFIMEGMWTRFFPAVQKARNMIMGTETEQPELGEIAKVFSDFNFYAADHEEYPTSFFYNRKLGGGASYLIAPYPFAAATLCFKNEPDSIKVVGQKDEATGVDIQGAMLLSFPPTGSEHDGKCPKLPGAGIASLSFGMCGETSEETQVVGSKGRLKIETPSHCPTKVSVQLKAHGRGQVGKEECYEYPLPEDTEEIKAAGGFFYPNSAGFIYEAAAVARCISGGKREVPQYTHAETLLNMRLVEEFRNQLGIKPITED